MRDPEARYFGGRVEEHSLVPLGETQPAKLLAVFVVDTNETELTTPFGN